MQFDKKLEIYRENKFNENEKNEENISKESEIEENKLNEKLKNFERSYKLTANSKEEDFAIESLKLENKISEF